MKVSSAHIELAAIHLPFANGEYGIPHRERIRRRGYAQSHHQNKNAELLKVDRLKSMSGIQ